MSADGSIEIVWGDGEYKFRMGLKEWREVQEKCNAGLIEIMDRISTRRWRVDDVREPIRIALIGGGVSPAKALELVKRYVDERPLMESIMIAFAILSAAVVGDQTDQVGKADAAAGKDGTDASPSRPSTEQAPSSGSLQ